MTLAFDLPAFDSPASRLDPRWKLAALVLAAVLFAELRRPAAIAAALGFTVLLLVAAQLPLAWVLRRVSAAFVLIALLCGWRPFLVHPGDEVLDTGLFALSLTGVQQSAALAARAATLVGLMLLVVATAPVADTFRALQALRLPRAVVHLLLLTYRYVHVVLEEFASLRTALRLRGYRSRANLHSYRTAGKVLGMLLVRSQERSERVGQAMRCRGFCGAWPAARSFRTHPRDVLAFTLTVGLASAVWGWDRCLTFLP